MRNRFLLLTTVLSAAALLVPAIASAKIIEVGKIEAGSKPSCALDLTGECKLFLVGTTVYQTRVGTNRSPMVVPANGRIVAWTIALAKLKKDQIALAVDGWGGESAAQITILTRRKATRKKKGGAIVVNQGEARKLEPYFGKTVQFPLLRSIRVTKGQVLALSVPTWAPVLAIGLDRSTTYKASRAKGGCDDFTGQTVQLPLKQFSPYYCDYDGARVAYSVTIVTDP